MTDWIQPTVLLYAFFFRPEGVISPDYEPCALYLYIPLFLLLFYLKQLCLSPHQSVTQHPLTHHIALPGDSSVRSLLKDLTF